jgi:archaellum component FlaF (FlaF/FlaG flagellin family)
MDCGCNPNVIYTGKTIVFRVLSPPWIPGHSYYITFDSGKDFLLFSILHIDYNLGVTSGTEFCGK